MSIKLTNTQDGNAQRLMIITSNKDLIDNPASNENVKSLLSKFQVYDGDDKTHTRDWSELEECTDSILDTFGIDTEMRIAFQGYNHKTNTDAELAQKVRELAQHIKNNDAAFGVSFLGSDNFLEDASIIADFKDEPNQNPVLTLSEWRNDNAYYDKYKLIDGDVIEKKMSDKFIVEDISAAIMVDEGNYAWLIAEEWNTIEGDNNSWSDEVNGELESLNTDSYFVLYADYSRF